jgi:hypothetical protein
VAKACDCDDAKDDDVAELVYALGDFTSSFVEGYGQCRTVSAHYDLMVQQLSPYLDGSYDVSDLCATLDSLQSEITPEFCEGNLKDVERSA